MPFFFISFQEHQYRVTFGMQTPSLQPTNNILIVGSFILNFYFYFNVFRSERFFLQEWRNKEYVKSTYVIVHSQCDLTHKEKYYNWIWDGWRENSQSKYQLIIQNGGWLPIQPW